jgi:hypothetical protein
MRGFLIVHQQLIGGKVVLGLSQISSIEPLKIPGNGKAPFAQIRMGNGQCIDTAETWEEVQEALMTATEPMPVAKPKKSAGSAG